MATHDPTLVHRSPILFSPGQSALLVVDVQEKLVPVVQEPQRLVWNIDRLLRGAGLLEVPALATEQYPQGLGETVPELRRQLPAVYEKRAFSARECVELFERLQGEDRRQLVCCGIETHVCVQQTVLDALAMGYEVQVVVDAVTSRAAHDKEFALRRMELSGATLTTTEAILFEWCESSRHEAFKSLSRLIREPFVEAADGPGPKPASPPAE